VPWDRARPARKGVEFCKPIQNRRVAWHFTSVALLMIRFCARDARGPRTAWPKEESFLKYFGGSRNYMGDENRAAEADCVETTQQGLAQSGLLASLRQRE
jgi:hypothetical protein